MQEEKTNVILFIDNYSANEKHHLEVAWNGKFGAKFKDENYFFRLQVAEAVCERIETVNIDLIHELFMTLGRVAQLNFSVYKNYHMLTQELLERGGHIYLFDYVCVAHISFDTFLSTANIRLSSERKKEILAYFDYLKKEETNLENQKLLADHIRSRFVE
ncbi:MAG: hypothetical protein LBE34_16740 [Flavobacteriaceae bacterium]|jgi:hypothetical protein|nr:hypothetical protein [Flavobacteriaceae bacterium]